MIKLWLDPKIGAAIGDNLSGETFCQDPDNGFDTDELVGKCQAAVKAFMPVAMNTLFSPENFAPPQQICSYYFGLCSLNQQWWKH